MSNEPSATEVRLKHLEDEVKEFRETTKQIYDLIREVRDNQLKAQPLQACPLCLAQAKEIEVLKAEVAMLKEYVAQAKGVGRAFQVLYGVLGIGGIGAALKYIFTFGAK